VNTLAKELPLALELWGEMMKQPRFDSARAEVWRGQELESVLRRKDDPGRIAVGEFNRLMYGDHPIGWEMSPEDLDPEDLSYERVSWLHRRILCPGNLILGVTGDVSWTEIEPELQRVLADWPACEGELPPIPLPTIRQQGGIFLIPREFEQSTIVLAHTSSIKQGDTADYFASRIANSVLGASGFSSRLLTRLRTERGYAYSASSLWTTPTDAQGLVGALTQTRAGATVEATRLILEVLEEMRRAPPTDEEVRTTVDEAVNGFVFNFESPSQVVLRQMIYRAEGLPSDWLESYLAGIQRVRPEDVLAVFQREVRPADLTILIVGNPDAFDQPLDSLGPVTVLDPDRR
jgi:zinc protease